MNFNKISLIAKHLFKRKFMNRGVLMLLFVFFISQSYVIISGWNAYKTQHDIRTDHQEESRKSWEDNPEKHPHRMAHFGSFAFRLQHPLSIFDTGLENYTGNVVFLEAHKQNSANFSEASFSTGVIRFGDLNLAMLLSIILPLIIFFIGYDVISREKESQTLKLMFLQGAKMKEILFGKTLGLFLGSMLFILPVLITLFSIVFLEQQGMQQQVFQRVLIIIIFYVLFSLVLCFFTVLISARSKNSSQSLLTLLGVWLFFFVVVPKTAQVVGGYLYPNPTRLAFKSSIERQKKKIGNGHDDNDPHFKSFKDSILRVHKVKEVSELPFNFGGLIMTKSEKLTAELFANEHNKLIDVYRDQNKLTKILAIINPYLAIKGISMSFSGTDFETYTNFLRQVEEYRYKQSQLMNKLQMDHIKSGGTGSEGKVSVIGKENWKNMPEFQYKYIEISSIIKEQITSILSLLLWLGILVFVTLRFSHKFKIM